MEINFRDLNKMVAERKFNLFCVELPDILKVYFNRLHIYFSPDSICLSDNEGNYISINGVTKVNADGDDDVTNIYIKSKDKRIDNAIITCMNSYLTS